MRSLNDEDIKIASFTPQPDVGAAAHHDYRKHLENGNIERAKSVGRAIAQKTLSSAALGMEAEAQSGLELSMQRGLLLVFSAVVSVEAASLPGVLEDVVKQEYYAELKREAPALYREATESGAFSFYYLAFRRGIELDRRIGQTFAMLCSHDGDSVYQELGEALWCWMQSKTHQLIKAADLKPAD